MTLRWMGSVGTLGHGHMRTWMVFENSVKMVFIRWELVWWLQMFTEMWSDFVRKPLPTMYVGTLDGRKGIVFDQLITDYTEWCRVLELTLIEASQNQGVISVESATDIGLARECTANRLLCPEMVHIQHHMIMVYKVCDKLKQQHQMD